MRDCAQDRQQSTPPNTLNQIDNLSVLQHIRHMNERPQQKSLVAVLTDLPTAKLLCRQVGRVVEVLPEDNVLVLFVDHSGRAYAITPIKIIKSLVLNYERDVA